MTTEVFEDLKAVMEYILEPTVNYSEALSRIETFDQKDLIKFKKRIEFQMSWDETPMTWRRVLQIMKNEWFKKPSAMRDMINMFIKYDSAFPGGIPSKRKCGIKRGE